MGRRIGNEDLFQDLQPHTAFGSPLLIHSADIAKEDLAGFMGCRWGPVSLYSQKAPFRQTADQSLMGGFQEVQLLGQTGD